MMWRLKKKKEFIITSGTNVGFKFLTSWRKDKNEVVIMTEKGPFVLDGKNKFFIEVSAKNADPVKLEVVPDFNKKVLNFVEVIDPNVKKKFSSIKFTGVEIIRQEDITFGEQLKNWDEGIEEYEKKLTIFKRSAKYFIIPTTIILAIMNMYLFIIKTDIYRYINLVLVFSSIGVSVSTIISYKKFSKSLKQNKELRGKVFEIVKEK